MEKLSVGCLEELLAVLGEQQKKGEKIYLLFCGDVDETTGESWCPDCVKGVCVCVKQFFYLANIKKDPQSLCLQ